MNAVIRAINLLKPRFCLSVQAYLRFPARPRDDAYVAGAKLDSATAHRLVNGLFCGKAPRQPGTAVRNSSDRLLLFRGIRSFEKGVLS